MPTIPRVEQRVGMPDQSGGVPAPERPLVEGYTAEGKVWGQVADVGDVITKIARADNLVKMSAAKVALDTDLAKLQADFSTRTDYTNFENDFTKRANQIRQQYQQKYGTVWGQLQPHMENHIARTKIGVDTLGRRLWIDSVKGEAENTIDELTKQRAYAEPGSPEEELAKGKINDVLSDLVTTGIYHSAAAEKVRRTLDNKADVYRVQMLKERDPEMLKTYLEERAGEGGGFRNFVNLTPEQRATAHRQADDEARSRRNQFYQEQNRYQDEVRYKVYDMMDGNSPASQVISYIDRMTQPDPQTGFRGLDAREAYAMKEKVRNGSGEAGGKTNYTVWKNLYQKGLDGTLTLDEINRQWGNGISTADAKGLSTMITKAEQKALTADQKELKTLVDRNMKDFSTYVKAAIGEGGKETSKDLAAAVIYDMQKMSEYIKDKKDMKWFEEYQQQAVKTALANNNKKYLLKLIERATTPGAYDAVTSGRTRRMDEGEKPKPKAQAASTGARKPLSAFDK